MKKLLVLSLAIVMLFAMATTCFAAKVTANNGTDTADVKATYAAGVAKQDTYSVDVTFGAMTFTYTDKNEGTWNPETHAYTGTVEAAWAPTAADANKITVTNHSNVAVTATLTYAAESAYSAITGDFDDATLELATAEETAPTAAPTASAYLTLSGALASGTTATKIGSITVTIAKG